MRVGPIDVVEGPPHALRLGSAVSLTASRPFETTDTVACGIPGYDRPGTELYADALVVRDEPFEWEFDGNCAFAVGFEYSSD